MAAVVIRNALLIQRAVPTLVLPICSTSKCFSNPGPCGPVSVNFHQHGVILEMAQVCIETRNFNFRGALSGFRVRVQRNIHPPNHHQARCALNGQMVPGCLLPRECIIPSAIKRVIPCLFQDLRRRLTRLCQNQWPLHPWFNQIPDFSFRCLAVRTSVTG